MHQVLADNPFASGGTSWSAERGLDFAARQGIEDIVTIVRSQLEEALEPAPPQWFGKRLPILWTLFMAARPADPRALTIWMSETAFLLGDLPHDIVAYSIDQAIKAAKHNFIPSIGEIRAVAEPLVAERTRHIDRLCQMEAALADPAATVARQERRASRARIEQYHQRNGE